jgi:hypothetical protein
VKLATLFSFLLVLCANAGTLNGHVRDMNWYAQYANNPFGVGYYEYAVNASASAAVRLRVFQLARFCR